jgi:hypothetical protein
LRTFATLIAAAVLAGGGAYAGWSFRGSETKTVTMSRTVTRIVGGATSVSDVIPTAVEATRAAIAQAADAHDATALRRLIPAQGFTYSYGGAYPGGATAYW